MIMIGIRNDDNGKLIIPKSVSVIIITLIAIISCVATVVSYGASTRADVSWLKDDVQNLNMKIDSCTQLSSQHQILIIDLSEDIKDISNEMDVIQKDIKTLLLNDERR